MALSAVAVLYLFPSDRTKIKKQFGSLSSLVSKEKGESAFTMAYKVNAIANLFADSCSFEFSQHYMTGDYTPEQITSNAAKGRGQFSKISLDFYDVVPDIQNDAAVVETTVRFHGEIKDSVKVAEETREIQCKLKKIEGKWKFTSFKVVEVLKK
ncbi:MAG TPA: hypothetical protein DET40_24995 [Lentisphaeria bacterium]|nr:MAG: hypothetical protein A2X45_18965 [Lentisphaerae bacterium GWF2_50_93]HCE46817.1 hypothetical protein [Lentisphaeria bacterium]